MLQPNQIEDLVNLITMLDRPGLLEQFHLYPARFPLDFSDEYLGSLSTERLRHIFLAVCLQNQRMPSCSESQAA